MSLNAIRLCSMLLVTGTLFCQPPPAGKPDKLPEPAAETSPADRFESGIAARVNRQVITRTEVWERLRGATAGQTADIRRALYDRELLTMIDELLVDQATERLNLFVDEKYVQGQIERTKSDLGGDAAYQDFLTERGLSETDYVDALTKESQRGLYLRASAGGARGFGTVLRPEHSVNPTVREVRDYYIKHLKDEFSDVAKVEIWFMAISRGSTARRLPDGTIEAGTAEKALALAQRIRQDLQTGADFKVLARRHSPATADDEGYAGWHDRETSSLAEEILEYAFDEGILEGAVSEPIPRPESNPRSYLIVKVTGRKEASVVPFSEAQKSIEQQIRQQRLAAALAAVKLKIVREAYIEPVRFKTQLLRSLEGRRRAVSR